MIRHRHLTSRFNLKFVVVQVGAQILSLKCQAELKCHKQRLCYHGTTTFSLWKYIADLRKNGKDQFTPRIPILKICGLSLIKIIENYLVLIKCYQCGSETSGPVTCLTKL